MRKKISILLVLAMALSLLRINPYHYMIFAEQDTYNEKYGLQLSIDNYEKEIYDNLVDNYVYKENDKGNSDGRYTGFAKPVENKGVFKFQLSKVYETAISSDSQIEGIVNNWASEQSQLIFPAVSSALDVFVKDYPQVYWMYGMKSDLMANVEKVTYLNTGKITIKVNLVLQLTPIEYFEGAIDYMNQFNDAVLNTKNDLINEYGITDNTSKKDILKGIYDFIAGRVDYNYAAVGDYSLNYAYAFMPLAVFLDSDKWDNLVVCEGYSKAFKILANQFGIECALVIGSSTNPQGEKENHMWNTVKMEDGKWYMVDATWGDQGNRILYNYFLSGNKTMGYYDICEKDHEPSHYFSSDYQRYFAYPLIEDFSYDENINKESEGSSTESTSDTVSGETTTVAQSESGVPTTETTITQADVTSETTVEVITTEGTTTEQITTVKPIVETTKKREETTTEPLTDNKQKYHWLVSGIKTGTYTGRKIKYKLSIKCGTEMLKEGKEFRVKYTNNINAGVANITIIPMGRFAGANSLGFSFKINKAPMKGTTVKKIKNQKYKKGKAVKPAVSIKYNGKKLVKGRDYTVKYKNNKKRGMATVIITGKGNFTGKKMIKFKIR